MTSIKHRIQKMEQFLGAEAKGRRYLDVWDESIIEHWPELATWALGYTDDRPDFWPSDEQAAGLRRRGYLVETREELREMFEDLLDLRRRHVEVGVQLGLCAADDETTGTEIERVKEWIRTIP